MAKFQTSQKFSFSWKIITCSGSYNQCNKNQTSSLSWLTYWGWDQTTDIIQMIFSNAFSSMKVFEFRFKFHQGLFLRVQLTINQYWFWYLRITNSKWTICLLKGLFRVTTKKTSKFCITGGLCGESTGDNWICLTKDHKSRVSYHFEGILPLGMGISIKPINCIHYTYPPCLCMAARALLAGYHRNVESLPVA